MAHKMIQPMAQNDATADTAKETIERTVIDCDREVPTDLMLSGKEEKVNNEWKT